MFVRRAAEEETEVEDEDEAYGMISSGIDGSEAGLVVLHCAGRAG